MMIAPVLANLGPLEELFFKPNPGEVQLSYFLFSTSYISHPLSGDSNCVSINSCFIQLRLVKISITDTRR